eukprot:15370748-Alexandrium_andersonii.AAC.1
MTISASTASGYASTSMVQDVLREDLSHKTYSARHFPQNLWATTMFNGNCSGRPTPRDLFRKARAA